MFVICITWYLQRVKSYDALLNKINALFNKIMMIRGALYIYTERGGERKVGVSGESCYSIWVC